MPKDFVYLADIDPTIQQDMRYASANNFISRVVPGYEAPECVLVKQAAEALKRVETDVRAKGFTLKVYDCYRPARAVAAFVHWAKEPDDPKAKTIYYPNLPKAALFPDYIATRSGHSRGATLDLTLVPLDAGTATSAPSGDAEPKPCTAPQVKHAPDGSVAMGTSFDCFDVKANTAAMGPLQRGERQSRHPGRGHAGSGLQELPQGVVALHPRGRALPRHDLRFPDCAAQVSRHARAKSWASTNFRSRSTTWMAGSSPAMTEAVELQPTRRGRRARAARGAPAPRRSRSRSAAHRAASG